jgi:hypothetical protein
MQVAVVEVLVNLQVQLLELTLDLVEATVDILNLQ